MAAIPPRDRVAFEAHQRRILADPACLVYVVEADGQVVGSIMSWAADEHRQLGYVIGRAFWGRGIASAALALFLAVDPTRPLYGDVAAHNVASQRVLGKTGFEEIRREQEDVEMVVFRLDDAGLVDP
jgi:RimJ/RimL family protein N-acetyltransferase